MMFKVRKLISDNLTSIFSKIDAFCIRETKEDNLKDLVKPMEIKCSWEKNQKNYMKNLKKSLKHL